MPKTFTLFFLLGMAAYTCGIETNNTAQTRIVGGVAAKEREIPCQVSLRFNGSHICGGSLVIVQGQQVILTAAHCIISSNASLFTVVAGNLNRNDSSMSEEVRQVASIVRHESFSLGTVVNDIALLFISHPFRRSRNVAPIRLPRQFQETTGNVVVSGWGRISTNGSESDVLLKIQLPVVDDIVCQRAYSNILIGIPPSIFCVGFLGVEGKSFCDGDSGGPLRSVRGGYLAGIISYVVNECALAEYPAVATEVSHYINWIKEKVREHK